MVSDKEQTKILAVERNPARRTEYALAFVSMHERQILITDLHLPGMDGIEWLKRLKETLPDVKVILTTAHGTIESRY